MLPFKRHLPRLGRIISRTHFSLRRGHLFGEDGTVPCT
jgi:hypothetical protein